MTEGQQMRIQFLILGFTGLKWYSRPWLSLVMLLVENYIKMDNVHWLVKENQNKQTNTGDNKTKISWSQKTKASVLD